MTTILMDDLEKNKSVVMLDRNIEIVNVLIGMEIIKNLT